MKGELFNVKETAAYARCSVALVYQWCREGLPHYRFGGKGRRGRIMIDGADLAAFLENCKVMPQGLAVAFPRLPERP